MRLKVCSFPRISPETHCNIAIQFVAKKRLAENSNNDGKMAKKARRLAEESIPNRNSILKHLQSGVGPSKTVSKEKAGMLYAFPYLL